MNADSTKELQPLEIGYEEFLKEIERIGFELFLDHIPHDEFLGYETNPFFE